MNKRATSSQHFVQDLVMWFQWEEAMCLGCDHDYLALNQLEKKGKASVNMLFVVPPKVGVCNHESLMHHLPIGNYTTLIGITLCTNSKTNFRGLNGRIVMKLVILRIRINPYEPMICVSLQSSQRWERSLRQTTCYQYNQIHISCEAQIKQLTFEYEWNMNNLEYDGFMGHQKLRFRRFETITQMREKSWGQGQAMQMSLGPTIQQIYPGPTIKYMGHLTLRRSQAT